MVADTGATPCLGGIRPLDSPQPVQVELGDNDMPAMIQLKPALSPHVLVRRHPKIKIDYATTGGSTSSPRADTTPVSPEPVEGSPYFESSETEGLGTGLAKGRWRKVLEVLDIWRIEDEWWRKKPISRLYYRVVLEDGTMVGLFKDLVSGKWYRQRV